MTKSRALAWRNGCPFLHAEYDAKNMLAVVQGRGGEFVKVYFRLQYSIFFDQDSHTVISTEKKNVFLACGKICSMQILFYGRERIVMRY